MVTAATPDKRASLPRPIRTWAARRAIARLKHDRARRVARSDLAPQQDHAGQDTAGAGTATGSANSSGSRHDRRPSRPSIVSKRTVGRHKELISVETALAVDVVPDNIFPPIDPPGMERLRAQRASARSLIDGSSRKEPGAAVLFLTALLCSGMIGFVLGEQPLTPDHTVSRLLHDSRSLRADAGPTAGSPATSIDAIAAAHGTGGPLLDMPGEDGMLTSASGSRGDSAAKDAPRVDPLWAQLGRLDAEILRLRVLFRRLADAAKLDDGEFDLDGEPVDFAAADSTDDALDLSIRALAPISEQSSRMARVLDARHAAYDRGIGGIVAPGTVRTSGFGYRRGPFGGQREIHRGVDFAGKPGTPIHALADGVVAFSGTNAGYGNLVEIEHSKGFRTRYAHNQSNLVAVGERVSKGEVIATLGSSGRSTGPHVHVEVRRNGAALDPAIYLR